MFDTIAFDVTSGPNPPKKKIPITQTDEKKIQFVEPLTAKPKAPLLVNLASLSRGKDTAAADSLFCLGFVFNRGQTPLFFD